MANRANYKGRVSSVSPCRSGSSRPGAGAPSIGWIGTTAAETRGREYRYAKTAPTTAKMPPTTPPAMAPIGGPLPPPPGCGVACGAAVLGGATVGVDGAAEFTT